MEYDPKIEDAIKFWEEGRRNRSVIKTFFMEPQFTVVPLETERIRRGLQNAIELCRSYKKGVEEYLAVHFGEMEREDAGLEYGVTEFLVKRDLERQELEMDLDDEFIMDRARKGKELCESLEDTFQEWSDAGELVMHGLQYNWLCSFIDYGPFHVAQTNEEAAARSSKWQQEMI